MRTRALAPARPGVRCGGVHPTVSSVAERLELHVDGRTVELSRPDKVLYPASGTTKRDVVEYLLAIAPVLLPHLAGRAVVLARFPDGVEAPWWFQSNCPPGRPAWLPVVSVEGARGQRLRYCRIEERAALAWAAGTGALELHPFLAAADRPAHPLALVLDLDPSPPAALARCCALALRIRALLGALGLTPVAKTSGRAGLHVVVPLDGTQAFEDTRALARTLADRLAREDPASVSASLPRAARVGKVLIDWRQNSAGLQLVAPYSLRGAPTPAVSTPVTWDEVAAGAAARTTLAFGPADVLARVAALGELFRAPAQRLPR